MRVRNKVVVVREELFLVANNSIQSTLLGQLLYWQERTKDKEL
ncbi:hypothetical protein [Anaerobacillus alkalilacustris]|nr:hypothetical protein [Anaerobacillus alkalilacustris]